MNSQLSPQYIVKDRIAVTILDMVDPAHFVVKETPDLLNPCSKAKKFLEAEDAMQKFYASVEPCFFQLPLKDAIVVVLYKDKFYRAKVIRILTLSAGHLFKVYLVDYGIECSIPRENIYEIEKDFLLHPFQAVNIKLLGIEPISLIMDKIDLSISYGPVSDWDPSAVIYVRDLQKSMCSAFIEVEGLDDLHVYGKLHFCFESPPTKCVNNELISKSYARFNEDCWKNITKLENILGGASVNTDNGAAHSKIFKNVNFEQVPCTAKSSETVFDGDFKMMFINPIDGKIVAESTLHKDNAENFSLMNGDCQLQNKIVPTKQLIDTKNMHPSNSEEKASESMAQSMTQKHFQKLLNKKKHQSPIPTKSTDNASNTNLQKAKIDNIIQTPTIPSENSCTNICSNEMNSQNNISSQKIVNSSINENTNVLKSSFAGEMDSSVCNENVHRNKMNHNHGSQNQNELPKPFKSELNPLSSCESNVQKDAFSKNEEKSETDNMTEAELINQKRLMKLQKLVAKRKSLSPIKAGDMDSRIMKISPTVSAAEENVQVDPCADKNEKFANGLATVNEAKRDIFPNKLEISHDCFSDTSNQNNQTQPSDETKESSESISKKENKSVTVSENLKHLQKLQKKVRLKQKKESLLEKSSKETNQSVELSVITSFDSSLCDSDSGLNSFSSSPSISEME